MADLDPVSVKINLDLGPARQQFEAFKQQMAQGVTVGAGAGGGPSTFANPAGVNPALTGAALAGPMNLGGAMLSPMMTGINQLTAVMAALPAQIANAVAQGLGGGGGSVAAGIGGALAAGSVGGFGGGVGMNRLALSLIAAAGGGRAGSLAWRFSRFFGANPAFIGALVGAGALDALATENAGYRDFRTAQLTSDNPFDLQQRIARRDLGGEGRWFGARASGSFQNFLGDLFPDVDSEDKVVSAIKIREANYARNRRTLDANFLSDSGGRIRDAYAAGGDSAMERQRLQEETAHTLLNLRADRQQLQDAIDAKFKGGVIPDNEWATYKSMTGRLASMDRTIANTEAQGGFDLQRLIYTQNRESNVATGRMLSSALSTRMSIQGNELGSAVASIKGQFLPIIDEKGKVIAFGVLDPKTDHYQEKLGAMREVYSAQILQAGIEDERRSITRRGAVNAINADIRRDPLGSELTQLRAQRDAALVGVTDSTRRQQIEDLFAAQSAHAVQQRNDQERILNLANATQHAVLARQLAMDPVGAQAAGISGNVLAHAMQLAQQGFGDQGRDALKNGVMQLDLLKQNFGLGFHGVQINPWLTDIHNARNVIDPMEVFKRIAEERAKLAGAAADPFSLAPFGGSSNAAAIAAGAAGIGGKGGSEDAAKDSTLKAVSDKLDKIITTIANAIKN